MKKVVEEAILDWYGAESIEELLETHMTELLDSVMPGFCRECGEYYGEVEPDAREYKCEGCGKSAVSSVQEILVF